MAQSVNCDSSRLNPETTGYSSRTERSMNTLSSQRFGEYTRDIFGYLVSNDQGIQSVIPELTHSFSKNTAGIGLFVGSGGFLSLLPDLKIEVPVMVDSNEAVNEVSRFICDLVMEKPTPEAVVKDLQKINSKHPITGEISNGENLVCAMFNPLLVNEARSYGNYHWSNPERFEAVKDALGNKPPVYVTADITEPEFSTALNAATDASNMQITFANMTNVHSWIDPKSMAFLRKWPFASDAEILYSTHRDAKVGDLPFFTVAHSLNQYIAETYRELNQ